MDFCKIKFHRGVEFNFASEPIKKCDKKYKKGLTNMSVYANIFSVAKQVRKRCAFSSAG